MTDDEQGHQPPEVGLRQADDLAAEAIREEVAAAPRVAPAARKARRPKGPIVAVVCGLVIVSQIPALRGSFDAPPSIRVGNAPDDEHTESCIDTLWKIASILQHRPAQEIVLLEPMTQRPYVVRHVDHDTVVECPNPGAHSLRSLHVSAARRAPEAVP